MAAAAGDHGTAWVDARPCDESLVNRLLEGEHGAAEITDGREPPQEGALGLPAGGQMDVADVALQNHGQRQRGEQGMPMRIDEARHHHAAAAIDGLRAIGHRGRARADGLDATALDEHMHPIAQRGGFAVEEAHAGEEGGLCRRGCRRLGPRLRRKAERRDRSRHAGDESTANQVRVDSVRKRLHLRAVAQTRGAPYHDVVGQGCAAVHGGLLWPKCCVVSKAWCVPVSPHVKHVEEMIRASRCERSRTPRRFNWASALHCCHA
jgi:hypothetical protein